MGYPVFRNQRLRISRWALAGPAAGSLPLSVSATAPRATDVPFLDFQVPSRHSTEYDGFVWICGSKVTKSIANQCENLRSFRRMKNQTLHEAGQQ